ncbi:M55 family metallopeptidase [Halomicrococcus sp. SG-WS-1]|uniref:M55 family metallopeptidase n=1 Tax=Halomicrococcus sp. SG-WS-1 TaxID=3439057 RepID=UPI003F793951
MRFFVVTDIEGVAGIDSFDRTRTRDEAQKAPAMDQLAREVDACIAGVRDVYPDAEVTVWDGHGSGGLREDDVQDATYVAGDSRPYFDLSEYDGQLFVGQHAMAGTVAAPLRHTYSSRSVESYRLNGTFVGEFGCRALVAGYQDVPTVFLSGDDKACHEAKMFVPEIETVAVKRGTGEESAVHRDPDDACAAVRDGTARAVERLDDVPPYTGLEPPYELDVRHYDPVPPGEGWWDEDADHVERVDDRTVRITGESVVAPHDEFYLAF